VFYFSPHSTNLQQAREANYLNTWHGYQLPTQQIDNNESTAAEALVKLVSLQKFVVNQKY
jgi:hypothetical protein